MGASTELIPLLIETRADLTGVRAARAETTGLGADSRRATEEAAAGNAKLSASIDQVRLAQERSNGDFDKFKQELAAIVTQENALAAAAQRSADALQKQAGTRPFGPFPSGPTQGPRDLRDFAGPQQLGPAGPGPQLIGPQLGPALPSTALRDEAEKSAAAIEKISPRARTAGNSLNLMAQAAANGQGSIAGLANAAGNMAFALTSMSSNARLAAGAAGIGVLIGAIGVLTALSIEAYQKLKQIPEGVLGSAGATHLQNLHEQRQVSVELAAIDAERARLQTRLATESIVDKAKGNAEKDLQHLVNLDAKREALQHRAVQIEQEDRARTLAGIAIEAVAREDSVSRYQGRLRVIEAERIAAIRNHTLTEAAANQQAANQRRDLAKQGEDFTDKLANDAAAARDTIVLNSFAARRAAADRALTFEKKKLDDIALSGKDTAATLEYQLLIHSGIIAALDREQKLANDAARQAVGIGSESLADNFRARMDQIESEKTAQIRAGIDVVTATAAAEQKKRQLFNDTAKAVAASLQSVMAITTQSNNERTKAIFNFVKNLRALELGYEAARATVSALREGAEAVASAARGDFGGAALHGAAAIKFAATAAVAASEAGGGSSGGGSAGGGSTGPGTTFQPRDANGGGSQVIVLQTVNPFSKEVINEVAYQLGRANVLKRPIPIAPTIGLQGAA